MASGRRGTGLGGDRGRFEDGKIFIRVALM